MIAFIPDSFLITLNSIEIIAIVYLAIAVSKLRADLARLEGRIEQHDREGDRR